MVPHFLWRRWYYGWWLPNTFYIKSSGVGGAWAQGGYYLLRVVEEFHLWVLPIVVAAGLVVERGRAARLLYGYALLVVGVFARLRGVGRRRLHGPVSLRAAGRSRSSPSSPRLRCAARCRRSIVTRRSPPSVSSPLALALHAWHAVGVDKAALVIPGPSDRGIDRPGFLAGTPPIAPPSASGSAAYAPPRRLRRRRWRRRAGLLQRASARSTATASPTSTSRTRCPHVDSRPGHQKYAPDEYILSKQPDHHHLAATIASRAEPYVGADRALWMQRGYHYVSVRVPGLIEAPVYSFLLRNDRSFGPLAGARPPEREP